MMDMVKSQRINRYIMECKLVKEPAQKAWELELIDTLWNVNIRDEGTVQDIADELIDTLWNVNKKNSVLLRCGNGINRYIMECK